MNEATVKDNKKTTQVEAKQEPMIILTETDAYIHERLKSQPKSFESIEVKEVSQQEGKHILSLPDEITKKYNSQFAFRWINKDKRMIDRAIDIRGWNIVNRVLFNEVPNHLFSANGTIERGDSILFFMPLNRAEILRSEPGIRSKERVRSLPIEKWKDGGEQYYKPTLGSEEKDGEEFTGGVQPDRKDFND
jgi:hypothetical protein